MVAISLCCRSPGIAGSFMESAAMVPRTVGGRACLHLAVAAFARFSQHLFFHLFICSRSLAIFGLPGDHNAVRQWDRAAGWEIQTLARFAGACNYAATRGNTIHPDVAAKPDVCERRNS